jgi:hypothetical protein
MIDHRTTFTDHPQDNNLAKRMVRIIKQGLRKYKLLVDNHQDWGLKLPFKVMGYCFSWHASLASFSPYQLLYGREPTSPLKMREKLDPITDLDYPRIWAQVLHDRAIHVPLGATVCEISTSQD